MDTHIVANLDALLGEYLQHLNLPSDDDTVQCLEYEVRHLLQVQRLYAWKSRHSVNRDD